MRRLLPLVPAVAAGLLLGGSPAPASAATSLTIRTSEGSVTRIGDYRPRRTPSLAAAERVFGPASSRSGGEGGDACDARWRRLRLRILFANFGGRPTCTEGYAQSFTVRGRRFRTWKGLRVGARTSAIRKRHPSAEFRQGSWWLRTAVSPFGDGEGEDAEYAVLKAVVADGRVRAFSGWIGAAGD